MRKTVSAREHILFLICVCDVTKVAKDKNRMLNIQRYYYYYFY